MWVYRACNSQALGVKEVRLLGVDAVLSGVWAFGLGPGYYSWEVTQGDFHCQGRSCTTEN